MESDRAARESLSSSRSGRPAVVGWSATTSGTSGRRAAAGSALNVVRHLLRSGLDPLLVTRVGDDEEGNRVVGYLKELGADARGVQTDPTLPTRRTLSPGPREGIATCAFEAIDWNVAADLLSQLSPSLIYQSLASLRSETARSALSRLQANAGVPCFLDIDVVGRGIREHDVRRLLLGSKWIRIRADNLSGLARPGVQPQRSRLWGEARAIRRAFALEAVVVECQGLPLLVVSTDRIARAKRPPGPARRVPADARDAATAALVESVLEGVSAPTMLRRAVRDAVEVGADQLGVTDPQLLGRERERRTTSHGESARE